MKSERSTEHVGSDVNGCAPSLTVPTINADYAIGRLMDAGIRATKVKVAIAHIFLDSRHGHYSAEDVQDEVGKRLRPIHISSVYRILAELCEARLLASVMLDSTRAVYQLNVGAPHDHLVCIQCSGVFNFTDPTLKARRQAVADEHGFRIERDSLVIYGTCHRCAEPREAEASFAAK
jgi:Fur family transcriptional regulator, ferric uptake regulator